METGATHLQRFLETVRLRVHTASEPPAKVGETDEKPETRRFGDVERSPRTRCLASRPNNKSVPFSRRSCQNNRIKDRSFYIQEANSPCCATGRVSVNFIRSFYALKIICTYDTCLKFRYIFRQMLLRILQICFVRA